jgi:broad specificity phosphatase PhoE
LSIVYETHSTTTDGEAGIATGWLHGELSAAGRRQARELGERRRGDGLTAVYSSDLRRASDTARIAFAGTAIPLYQDARLRECHYGDLDGAPAAEVAAVRSRHVEVPFPGGGQSYRDVVAATASFLRDLTGAYAPGARILLLAHSANRWALRHLLAGEDLPGLLAEPFVWQPGWEFRA